MRKTLVNSYRVGIETNQAGRYVARLEAHYAGPDWRLRVYLAANSPQRLRARLEEALRFLQRREEDLWLWGSNASDRGLLFEELLDEGGLKLDRRREAPRSAVTLTARPGETFRPRAFSEFRRKLNGRLEPAPRTATQPAEVLSPA